MPYGFTRNARSTVGMVACIASAVVRCQAQADKSGANRIRLDSVGAFGGLSLDPGLTFGSQLAISGGTRPTVVVAPTEQPWSFIRMDLNGDHPTTFGKRGDGPSEFRSIRYAAPYLGDSVAVLEATRVTIMDLNSLNARSFRLPKGVQSFSFVIRADGGFIFNSYGIGKPTFVVTDSRGKLMRRFGPMLEAPKKAGAERPDPDRLRHFMTMCPGDKLISVPLKYDGTVRIWAVSTGTEIKHPSAPTLSWFDAYTNDALKAETNKNGEHTVAHSFVEGVACDAIGHLWVLGRVSDPHWDHKSGEVDKWLDAVIDAFDVKTGRQIATYRSDEMLYSLSGAAYAIRRTSDLDGAIHVVVWKLLVE